LAFPPNLFDTCLCGSVRVQRNTTRSASASEEPFGFAEKKEKEKEKGADLARALSIESVVSPRELGRGVEGHF